MPIVVQAANGSRGFDYDDHLTEVQAASLFESGYAVCLRYIGRAQGVVAGDLTSAETKIILASGLALMPVQHVAGGGGFWNITDGLGAAWGKNAALNARTAGIMPGVTVWLDLEMVAEGTPHAAIVEYCNDWFTAVSAGGFVPGVYVGANAWLNPRELYGLNTQHYWRAAGNIPDIATRGYQMRQSLEKIVNGLKICEDLIGVDSLGGLPLVMTNAAAVDVAVNESI